MQFFEVVFLVVFAISIVRLLVGPIHSQFKFFYLGLLGLGTISIGFLIEGLRWQMIPAYFGFAMIMLSSLKSSRANRIWRNTGAMCLLILLSISTFLIHQLPVLSLPEPSGPYGVGTFDYSITDTSRVERFAPERNRELYVEVWYPATKDGLDRFPVRTLFQEVYEGSYDLWSFLFGYLRQVPTHSHIEATIANSEHGKFPVLLYNHGASSVTSQNQLLMEHLTSHGYVIFSISHPYQSLKVNLANAGTIHLANRQPSDIPFRVAEMERNLFGNIVTAYNFTPAESSPVRAVFLGLANDYATASDEVARDLIIANALESGSLRPYAEIISNEALAEHLQFIYVYQGRSVEYWVEDIQFIADSLTDLVAPIPGFSDILDTSGFGVFGMSLGGAAAGEFCKLDSRCRAGCNLDGTQLGRHWDQKLAAPFLMLYHEEHQGGNDYAYLPPQNDFWDITVKGSTHLDFMDVALTHPIAKTAGLGGEIDGARMLEIINIVQLRFFDQYLKGIPGPDKMSADIPEIVIRTHETTGAY